MDPLGAYVPERIEWADDDGVRVSAIPKRCADTWRDADGRVRVPRAT